MIKRSKEEIQEFAGEILNRYFCDCDVDFLISTFADDIVWLGAGELQKAEGKEAVAACFLAGREDLSPCDMYDEVYEVRFLTDFCRAFHRCLNLFFLFFLFDAEYTAPFI